VQRWGEMCKVKIRSYFYICLPIKKSIILVSVLSWVGAMVLVSCSSSGTPQTINEDSPATPQTSRGTDQLPLGRTYETDQLPFGREGE
jgi:hypothetical protein